MQTISPSQCQCARVLLKWDQGDLAARCGLHVQTICLFETEKSTPTKRTLEKITVTLENAGIEFTDGDGVRKQTGEVRILRGENAMRDFMDDVYATAKIEGGKIRLFNGKPIQWYNFLGEEWYKMHSKRMTKIKDNFNFRITTNKDERLFIAKNFAEYRWFTEDIPNDKAFYCYGRKMAFLYFGESSVTIQIIEQKEIAEAFCILFDKTWDSNTIIPASK